MVKRSARDGRPELICGPSVSGLRRFMMGICVSAREEEVRVRKRSVNRVGRCMVMVGGVKGRRAVITDTANSTRCCTPRR